MKQILSNAPIIDDHIDGERMSLKSSCDKIREPQIQITYGAISNYEAIDRNQNEKNGKINNPLNMNITDLDDTNKIHNGSIEIINDPVDNGMYLLKKELSSMTLKKIGIVIKLSLVANTILFLIKILVFIVTGSFAVIAALTDSFCDLVSQTILYYTHHTVHKQKPEFPAGRTRLEPIGILIMSIIMIILSFSVIVGSIITIINIYTSATFTVSYTLYGVVLLVCAIIFKIFLWLYCRQFKYSPTATALAEDHLNDVLSNSTALIAVCVASQIHSAVWCDPVGAILITTYIIWTWWNIGLFYFTF